MSKPLKFYYSLIITYTRCTDENIVFRCDSDKKLTRNYFICLKNAFPKIVEVIILFLCYTVHVDQV